MFPDQIAFEFFILFSFFFARPLHIVRSNNKHEALIMEAQECKKSAFWFERRVNKSQHDLWTYATFFLVSQKCKRVIKGVAYELIGSFSIAEKGKINSIDCFFVLSVINLRSGMERTNPCLLSRIALALQINQMFGTLHNEIKLWAFRFFSTMPVRDTKKSNYFIIFWESHFFQGAKKSLNSSSCLTLFAFFFFLTAAQHFEDRESLTWFISLVE